MTNTPFVKLLFGSHLYGLDTPDSDKDYKGIFLPTREQLLLGNTPRQYSSSTGNDNSRNTADDVDFECFSLHEFVRLACKGETVAMDMLHAKLEHIEEASLPEQYIWYQLQKNRQRFYCKDMKAYMGYVRKQAHKYGVKGSRLAAAKEVLDILLEYHAKGHPSPSKDEYILWEVEEDLPVNEYCRWVAPEDDKSSEKRRFYEVCGRKLQDTLDVGQAFDVVEKIVDGYGHRAKQAETNYGIDWKAISHALRAGYQLLDIYTKEDFEYPLEQTAFLLDVKQGKLDFTTQVQPELESLVERVEKAAEKSTLPSKPDRKWWDEWLIDVMEEYVL